MVSQMYVRDCIILFSQQHLQMVICISHLQRRKLKLREFREFPEVTQHVNVTPEVQT